MPRGKLPNRGCAATLRSGQPTTPSFASNSSPAGASVRPANDTIVSAIYPGEGAVDKYSRLIVALVIIGLVGLRIVRYIQISTGRRRISTIPRTLVPIPNQPPPEPTDPILSPQRATSSGFSRRGLGSLAGIGSWLAANALLWTALFGFPYLNGVPVFWRLFAGVFVNLYLLRLSRDIAQRVTTNTDNSRSTASPFD